MEFKEGLARLGITLNPILPYCAFANGKAEVFWGQVEGRLMAMLQHAKPLRLDLLNRATQAWHATDQAFDMPAIVRRAHRPVIDGDAMLFTSAPQRLGPEFLRVVQMEAFWNPADRPTLLNTKSRERRFLCKRCVRNT